MDTSQSFPLEICYFKVDSENFIEKLDYCVTASHDTSLRDTLSQIPSLSEDLEQVGLDKFVCQGGNSMGEVVDLNQKPLSVEYIFDALHAKLSPVLYITSKSRRHDSAESGICVSIEMPGRSKTMFRRPSSKSVHLLKDALDCSSSSDSDSETVLIHQTPSNEASLLGAPDEMADVFPISPEPLSQTWKENFVFPDKKLSSRQKSQSTTNFDLPGLFESPTTKTARNRRRYKLSIGTMVPPYSPARSGQVGSSTTLPTITAPTGQEEKRRMFRENREQRFNRKRTGAMKRRRGSSIDLNVSQVVLQVSVTSSHSIEVPCHSHVTVGELKQLIGKHLSLDQQVPLGQSLHLSYDLEGTRYELFDDSQMLATTLFLKSADTQSSPIPGLAVSPIPEPARTDLVTIYRITQLTQVILDERVRIMGGDFLRTCTTIAPQDRPEMEAARRTLHDYVNQVASQRSTEDYVLSVEIAREAASANLILKVPFNNQISVTLHYKQVFSLTRPVSVHETADSVLKRVHHCLKECDLISNSVEAYTMQLSGVNSYIHGNHELITFKDIRHCIVKREAIHMSVIVKPSPLLYQPFSMSWLPLDPNSFSPPHQVDVSEAFRKETRSIWECPPTETFSLNLVRAENLPFHSSNLLSVELSLHHGASIIHGVRSSEHRAQDSFTMTWGEEIDFITPLRDVPKDAKLLVIVRNSNSNVFYYGLMNVFDHQSKLKSGHQLLTMWELKFEGSPKPSKRSSVHQMSILLKEREAFSSILSGPATNNPSPSAVRVIINFSSHERATYYPSVCDNSREKLFREHPSFRNVKLRKHFSEYLAIKFNMRASKKPYHNLPVHLETIGWDQLFDRMEVYSILSQISNTETHQQDGTATREYQTVPLHVAFRLLDKDFPDEEVRAFATKVVEHHVQDGFLEDYLLQLTQALKFEHGHDSALARFLLREALMNKRIGHMFFWYLRAEMQNPQYMLRFAVILEAYLKGCGEAILTRYMDHIAMQDTLESIGQKLKDTFGKDHLKMQQVLPKELIERELQMIKIVPACNPRVTLGALRPSRCKVLSSAKKPIFLEMVNVTASALQSDPVRLIMKMGDDLRQDVITLRMLSLFEKLWENEGLDLKLIPYGCMATGPRTGFIEVVRNSKTIAEVSGVRDSNKLYEWIKRHQTDEFGAEDPEKMRAAIDTFVHSCAGYSVATYILGIGDRHNDNIMITTSGNLFHIDFGHFLGNIKHFMKFKREWAPFVLTPDFTHVMGGEDSATFRFYKHLCTRAFLILRRHADLIINLFSMMRSTGIPELTCVEDTDYIKVALAVSKSDTEAEREFHTIIQKCLDLKWTVQVMWAFHKIHVSSPKTK